MKTAVCGIWHVHAEEYFLRAKALTEVVGVWEENEQWRKDFCEKHQVPAFGSFEELLASDADSVIVCTPTNQHTEVMLKLANAGKNIFTEKVMALTDEDAEKIAEAVEKNGVRFVISLPHKYGAGVQTVKAVVDSGELGKLNYLRFRNCHSGSVDNWLPPHFYNAEACGGGAMIDLGAHGMYLTDWICGMPDSFTSVFTNACTNEAVPNTDRVEDNAITMMGYENGCIALNETGFVSRGYPMSLEVGGEKGYVRFDNTGVHKCTRATDLKTVAVPLCEALPKPIDQFLTGNILDGCGMTEAKHLTHMMVCAYQNRV